MTVSCSTFQKKTMSTQHISFQECITHFPQIFERVLNNHQVIAVRNDAEQEIVLLDAEEYSSLIETLYLLSNATNANRLREGMQQHQQGQVKEIDVTAYSD